MTSEPTLPEELLLKIFEFIDDRHALFDVLFVSRLFRRLGELILYESVTIRNPRLTKPRMSQFHNTITSREDLCARVKSLTLIAEPSGSLIEVVSFHKKIQPPVVFDILCKLPSLQRLRVQCQSSFLDLPNTDFVLPFALTHIRWYNHMYDDGRLLSGLLESQSTLEFLDIQGRPHRVRRLTEQALPRLRVLLANPSTAFDILPTRHVSHLAVAIGGSDNYRVDDVNVLASFENIQSLHCSAEFVEDATNFAMKFPNLMYLSLSCDSTLNGSVRRIATEASKLFLSLRSQKIKYITLTFEIKCFPKFRKIRALFVAFPKLLAVDFRARRKDPSSYHRYTRDSLSPILGHDQPAADEWGLWWQHRGLDTKVDTDTDMPVPSEH